MGKGCQSRASTGEECELVLNHHSPHSSRAARILWTDEREPAPDTGNVRRYSVEQMWREFPSDDECIHSRDHDAVVARLESERDRARKWAEKFSGILDAINEVIDGMGSPAEQIAAITRALDTKEAGDE